MGYSEDAKVIKVEEYNKERERQGFIAGKHIPGEMKWWFQR